MFTSFLLYNFWKAIDLLDLLYHSSHRYVLFPAFSGLSMNLFSERMQQLKRQSPCGCCQYFDVFKGFLVLSLKLLFVIAAIHNPPKITIGSGFDTQGGQLILLIDS